MNITLQLSAQSCTDIAAQAYVVFCEHPLEHAPLESLKKIYPPLEAVIAQRTFTGKAGSSCVVTGVRDGQPAYVMLIGVGSLKDAEHERVEQFRRAVGTMIRAAEPLSITRLAVCAPSLELVGKDPWVLGKEFASTVYLAAYHFNGFITDKARCFDRDYDITLCIPEQHRGGVELGIEYGTRVGRAVNQSRQWCDLPALNLTPTDLANQAQRIAQAHDLKITVFDKAKIYQEKMGGIIGVSRGSSQEPRLVIMEYKSDAPKAPTLALVGKGITFDSGGLSIKPAVSMETMKDDMAGAAAVISTMEAIAHLKPKVNVIAAAPICENMINGEATRPGDILTFYDGTTAEVKNTDAEGRLVLADAMAYVKKHYKIDHMITVATLTGSCAAALGPFFAGLMTQDESMKNRMLAAGRISGDRLWPLPLHDDYRRAIRCDVADLCNIGSDRYKAGAITAGFFLKHFAGDLSYVHLDIAGTAFNVPDIAYYRPGATGFGVRLLVDLLSTWE